MSRFPHISNQTQHQAWLLKHCIDRTLPTNRDFKMLRFQLKIEAAAINLRIRDNLVDFAPDMASPTPRAATHHAS